MAADPITAGQSNCSCVMRQRAKCSAGLLLREALGPPEDAAASKRGDVLCALPAPKAQSEGGERATTPCAAGLMPLIERPPKRRHDHDCARPPWQSTGIAL